MISFRLKESSLPRPNGLHRLFAFYNLALWTLSGLTELAMIRDLRVGTGPAICMTYYGITGFIHTLHVQVLTHQDHLKDPSSSASYGRRDYLIQTVV